MGYFIRPDFLPSPAAAAEAAGKDKEILLRGSDAAARKAALARLVAAGAERELTECLASEDAFAVQLAAAGLWEVWSDEAGPAARRRLEEGVETMGRGDFDAAAAAFAALASDFPGWAEALNKLATVRYLQNDPAESIACCRRVLTLKPDHFGAWNGLALCAVQLEDWALAREAARESLRLQPASDYNKKLLRLIESRLATI